MKTCSKCGDRKPLDEFYKDSSNSTGRRSSCKSCDRARYHANGKIKTNHYSHLGVTKEEFIELREQRDSSTCEICGNGGQMNIDHDHATGAVRGILCSPCNQGLGLFEDNMERMESAVMYLALHRSENG